MKYLNIKYNVYTIAYFTEYFMYGIQILDFTKLIVPVKYFIKGYKM